MNMRRRKINRILAGGVLFLSSFLTACIYSSDEDCELIPPPPAVPSIVSFPFIYEYNPYYADRFEEEIDYIHLFIYDAAGDLHCSYETHREAMEPVHTVTMELEDGEYTVVAWGNCDNDHYAFTGISTIDTHRLSLTCIDNNEITVKEPGSLFHSINRFSVEGEDVTVPMAKIKNSNELKVIIKGLKEADRNIAEELFYTRLESRNTVYTHDNRLCEQEPVSYLPVYYRQGEDVVADFHVLRLFADDTESKVILRNRENNPRNFYLEKEIVPRLRELYEEGVALPLVQNISFDEYLERWDGFELYFEVEYDDDGMFIIAIRPWDGIDQPGEL